MLPIAVRRFSSGHPNRFGLRIDDSRLDGNANREVGAPRKAIRRPCGGPAGSTTALRRVYRFAVFDLLRTDGFPTEPDFGWSPMTVFTGQTENTGHLRHPAASAIGHNVMVVSRRHDADAVDTIRWPGPQSRPASAAAAASAGAFTSCRRHGPSPRSAAHERLDPRKRCTRPMWVRCDACPAPRATGPVSRSLRTTEASGTRRSCPGCSSARRSAPRDRRWTCRRRHLP